ncbi:MAG: XylR N-terminal domain-containing protein [Candidatus Sabulitectum sp.]|nr:XylR N-terminal domain-containing protein [Candidatus Sabulitectum sp.]
MPKYVKCPDAFAPLFEMAENMLTPIFENFERRPDEGKITISSERFVLYRGESMAIALKDQLTSVLGSSAGVVIYQIGKAAGAADARYYFEKTGTEDTILKLAMGPTSFALNGYANVTILPETTPTTDENFLLVYDQGNSYEADAHLKAGLISDTPVDFFTVGYSAGWCTESFGVQLEAKEITCKAMGDPQCRIVIAPQRRIRERVKEIKTIYPG